MDFTFEVTSYRTVLSEGWHEVEHDLRYQCKDDWTDHNDLSRALNGIFASLETADWSMLKLFEELSYRHYKSQEWSQMIRTKFRFRSNFQLSHNVNQVISKNQLRKKLYRLDRDDYLMKVLKQNIDLPVTLDNIVYICNALYLECSELTEITPTIVLTKLS